MSHTNSTTNYNLPQFLTGDKPAWLTDINNAFADIDTAIATAQSKADTAYNDAGTAQGDATTALSNAAAADAKGAGAVASIAAAFDSTTIYAVGTKVMYNSLLYRCTVAVTTPGPWTGAANWERVTVDGIIPTNSTQIDYSNNPSDGTVNQVVEALKTQVSSIPVVKSVLLSFTVSCRTSSTGLTPYRSSGAEAGNITTMAGYPIGKTILGYSVECAYLNGGDPSNNPCLANILNNTVYVGSTSSGDVYVVARVFYVD